MKLTTLLVFLASLACAAEVKIVQQDGRWQLLRDNKPYFINGAGGSSHLDDLVAAGGNSIRTWSVEPKALDEARERGLTVCMGIHVGLVRHGFDYANQEQVESQRREVRETVLKLKDHPALLMWALGNELELGIDTPARLVVWQEVERLAKIVKEADPAHPVIAVLAGAGKTKLTELKEHIPSIDAVGINAYGGMLELPEAVAAQGWEKPYIVTEFGPRGHWEVAKTAWGMPLEDTSTQKAEFYLKAYRHAIQDRPQCLGSYVFLWGNKQEKTHTWYGTFLPEGNPLGAVDAISFAWTGKQPANRAPRIAAPGIRIAPAAGPYKPGAKLRCRVRVTDPDGDTVKIAWDIRKDVADAPQTGGDAEPATPVLAKAAGASASLAVPGQPGNYRLFVYAYDRKDAAATANVPFQVKQ
ncbi:MAG: glycoside hydrolase family 2 TIM barrel-domain containing protein [Acidobacteriota bacterium]